MKLRMFLSAFFKIGNIGALLLTAGGAYLVDATMTGNLITVPMIITKPNLLIPFAVSVFAYLVLVGQTLLSKNFHTQFNHKQKIRQIQNLNYACLKQANEAKKHTNTMYLQKLRKVMEDKNEIVSSFFRGEQSFIKEKIVEQTLNLVFAYIKLLINFCIRSRELSEMDLREVTERINANNRKLNFTKDLHMAQDMKSLVEMDEKIIHRQKEEKTDLERISAKLDYMESTVNMFKHQIITSIEPEELLGKLEKAVNEATALDHVLEDRRRSKMRY